MRAKDVGVVVEASKRSESVFVLLELDEAVAQRLSHHLTPLGLLVVHDPTLNTQETTATSSGRVRPVRLLLSSVPHLGDAGSLASFHRLKTKRSEFLCVGGLGQVVDTQARLRHEDVNVPQLRPLHVLKLRGRRYTETFMTAEFF